MGKNHFKPTLPYTEMSLNHLPFISKPIPQDCICMFVDLTRPCDACGKIIGGGFKHCLKCNIYLCFLCGYKLLDIQCKFPIECPMCGEKFEY